MFNLFQIPKWRVPRLLKSEELSLTGQGLLRFIELKTFRSVTGYSISIVNMPKQDDGSTTGEILHRLDYPSVYNSQQTDLTEAVTLVQSRYNNNMDNMYVIFRSPVNLFKTF